MNKIKELRLKKGMTRAELSRVSGVSVRTLENWETGVRTPTAIKPLMAVAKALGCDVEDLRRNT